MRWYVEEASGFFGQRARLAVHPALPHGLHDCTDAPCPTVVAGRPVYVVTTTDETPAVPSDRPEYRVPLMSELPAPADDAPTVASTFSGCGGACLGYKMAGYRTLVALEFIDEARRTYEANFPGVRVIPDDVRQVTADDLYADGVPDVVEGSPPCSSFSTAGSREAGWGAVKKYSDKSQRTDDLFFEFARLIRDGQPRFFTAENVPGLLIGKAKGYFIEIRQALRDCGYRVEAAVLDAQWLGVPQRRKRLIFVGVRNDLEHVDGGPLMPVFPRPLTYRYTLRDVIGQGVFHDTSGLHSLGEVTEGPAPTVTASGARHLQVVTRGQFDEGGWTELDVDQPAPTVMAQGINGSAKHQTAIMDPWQADGTAVDPETGERIDLHGTALYEDWKRGRLGQPTRYINTVMANDDASVGTVTAMGGHGRSTAGVILASSPRKFTLAELRRICSFPDDFVLTGTYAQRWERLGRAVPPLMSRAIAETVRRELIEQCAV